MYLISTILLLSIPKVFGDFEQIRKRQYEPAIGAQKRIDWIWKEGVVKQNKNSILAELDPDFTFYGLDGVEHDRDYFIDEFLFKLNISISPETLDIKLLYTEKRKFKKVLIDAEIVKTAVQWGGQYMYLEFNHFPSENYFPLISVRSVSSKRPKVVSELDMNLALYIVSRMNYERNVFSGDFFYRKCDGSKITDGKSFVGEVFGGLYRTTEHYFEVIGDPFEVLDAMHYFRNMTRPSTCYGVIECDEEYAQRVVQFEMPGLKGSRHLFEVDWVSERILKGIERCEGL